MAKKIKTEAFFKKISLPEIYMNHLCHISNYLVNKRFFKKIEYETETCVCDNLEELTNERKSSSFKVTVTIEEYKSIYIHIRNKDSFVRTYSDDALAKGVATDIFNLLKKTERKYTLFIKTLCHWFLIIFLFLFFFIPLVSPVSEHGKIYYIINQGLFFLFIGMLFFGFTALFMWLLYKPVVYFYNQPTDSLWEKIKKYFFQISIPTTSSLIVMCIVWGAAHLR